MSNLKNKILEIVGDEDKAKEIVSGLKDYMIPKEQYNSKIDELKLLQESYQTIQTEIEKTRVDKMSAEERIKHREASVVEKEKEYLKKINRLDAERTLVGAGLTEDDYSGFIDDLISEDADKTKVVVENFVNVIKKKTESAIAQTKETLIKTTPKPENNQPLDSKPKEKPKKNIIY